MLLNKSRSAGGAAGRGSRSLGWVGEFLEQRNIQHLLLTRGGRGVTLYRREYDAHSTGARSSGGPGPLTVRPGRLIEASDTTGAGDTLLSAYLEALDREADPGGALRRALQRVEGRIEEGTL